MNLKIFLPAALLKEGWTPVRQNGDPNDYLGNEHRKKVGAKLSCVRRQVQLHAFSCGRTSKVKDWN
jgi:hypothetical protein